MRKNDDIQAINKEMGNIRSYKNFEDKGKVFASYQRFENKEDLFHFLDNLTKYDLIYRGLNNASFKIYSSAQRHWNWKDGYYKNIGGSTFTEYINRSINLVKSDKKIIKFFVEHNIPINDF